MAEVKWTVDSYYMIDVDVLCMVLRHDDDVQYGSRGAGGKDIVGMILNPTLSKDTFVDISLAVGITYDIYNEH